MNRAALRPMHASHDPAADRIASSGYKSRQHETSHCFLAICFSRRLVRLGARAGQRQRQPATVAAARQSGRSQNAGQGIVRPQADAGQSAVARHRLLHKRLPGRRHCIAGQRADLAGHAAVTQPQLGPPGSGQVPGAAGGEGAEGRLERLTGRRHGAGARRTDDDRTCQPSGRARCRYLADPDAGPRIDAARA